LRKRPQPPAVIFESSSSSESEDADSSATEFEEEVEVGGGGSEDLFPDAEVITTPESEGDDEDDVEEGKGHN